MSSGFWLLSLVSCLQRVPAPLLFWLLALGSWLLALGSWLLLLALGSWLLASECSCSTTFLALGSWLLALVHFRFALRIGSWLLGFGLRVFLLHRCYVFMPFGRGSYLNIARPASM